MEHDIVQAVVLLDGVRMPGWLVITPEWIRLIGRAGSARESAREEVLTHRTREEVLTHRAREEVLTHRARAVALVTPVLAVLPVPRSHLLLCECGRTGMASVGRWSRRALSQTLTAHGYAVEHRRPLLRA